MALRLQQNPNGKLSVVGFTDEQEDINVKDMMASARST